MTSVSTTRARALLRAWPWATSLLVVGQVGWFVTAAIATGRSDFIDPQRAGEFGGLITPFTAGDTWRLASAAFIHADPMSLIAAVALTAIAGALIERLAGARHTLLTFAIAALASNGIVAGVQASRAATRARTFTSGSSM